MVATAMIDWFKKNKVEAVIILIILLGAIFLRFYRLSEYMTFLGDEGRDALIIKNLLVDHDLPFIGPPTSVGNIYLGPLYYYMMAFSMAIVWLNPIGAAGMVAVVGVATVALIYYLARQWFGFWPAVLAATLYVVSPVTITYSRSSWNPNPAPFFALLGMLGLYRARVTNDFRWLILTGAAASAVMQMHYLAMILIPTFGILWLSQFWGRRAVKIGSFLGGTLGAVVAFVLLMFPWMLFEFKHDFLNSQAVLALFSEKEGAITTSGNSILERIPSLYFDLLIGRYMAGENAWLMVPLAILVLVPVVFLIKRLRQKQELNWPLFALLVWLGVGLLGLSLYQQNVYDHYLGFLNPVPYLLLGGAVHYLKGRWQVLVALSLLIVVGFFNLQKLPLQYAPNRQLQRTQEIARFVIEKSENKPFNFALIAERNYDSAYQFYLDIYGQKPKVVPVEITDQLFVVCEDSVCQPAVNSKYEIAAFGMSKVESQFEIAGIKIYKMVHNPTGQPS